MTDFTYVSDSLDESADFSVDEIKLGDGYSQRIPNGINSALRKWNVSFTDRTKADADAIVDFFRTRAGVASFTWQPQGYTADLTVVCPSYSRPIQNRYKNGDFVYTVTASFKEVPL